MEFREKILEHINIKIILSTIFVLHWERRNQKKSLFMEMKITPEDEECNGRNVE